MLREDIPTGLSVFWLRNKDREVCNIENAGIIYWRRQKR